MNRIFCLAIIMLACLCPPAAAATLQVTDNLRLDYQLPEGWQATPAAPEFLVRQTVEHVSMHLREAGKALPASLESQVRERLANNELFIYHEQTRAHLDIDFSPIDASENPPLRETVAKSADYAEQELSSEPDVTELESRTGAYTLSGADYAYRIDASFKRDGEPHRFVGIIAFAGRHWLFLYYTDETLLDSDLQQLDELLKGLAVVAR